MGGSDMAPQTPQPLVAPRRSRGAPRPPRSGRPAKPWHPSILRRLLAVGGPEHGIQDDAGDDVPHRSQRRERGWADLEPQERRALEPADEPEIGTPQTRQDVVLGARDGLAPLPVRPRTVGNAQLHEGPAAALGDLGLAPGIDRKSTRLNSSHANISYAVFCLKKKKN